MKTTTTQTGITINTTLPQATEAQVEEAMAIALAAVLRTGNIWKAALNADFIAGLEYVLYARGYYDVSEGRVTREGRDFLGLDVVAAIEESLPDAD